MRNVKYYIDMRRWYYGKWYSGETKLGYGIMLCEQELKRLFPRAGKYIRLYVEKTPEGRFTMGGKWERALAGSSDYAVIHKERRIRLGSSASLQLRRLGIEEGDSFDLKVENRPARPAPAEEEFLV